MFFFCEAFISITISGEDDTWHRDTWHRRAQFSSSICSNDCRRLIALAGAGLGRPTWAQSPKPNIVFILADDLGYADVSCYGQRDYTTPNIDRLALEGTRFTQAYSNSPDCSTTRTALITDAINVVFLSIGRANFTGKPQDIGLPPSHPTLPSLLKKAGYNTTLVGKWHLVSCRISARSRAATTTSSEYTAAVPIILITVLTPHAAAIWHISSMRKRCRSSGTVT